MTGKGAKLMAKFWRRKAQQDTRTAQPAPAQPAPGPVDLAAWAREADVSRRSSQAVREAEDYLNTYRHMNLELSQQMGWRVMAAIEAQVTPSPPPFAQPLDVIATVLALGGSSPALAYRHCRLSPCPRWVMRYQARSPPSRPAPACHMTLARVWDVGRLRRPASLRSQPCTPHLVSDWFTGVRNSPRAGAGKILPRRVGR